MNEMTRWTPADEAALRELLERKAACERDARAAIDPLMENLFVMAVDYLLTPHQKQVAFEHIVKNADAWRDALNRFDSGARPG